QQQVLSLLEQRGVAAPRVIRTAAGGALTEIDGVDDGRHFVWAVSHVPGRLLADVPHRMPALLEELGARIGQLTAALDGVAAPALDRTFHWDLASAVDLVMTARPRIRDEALCSAIDAVVERVSRYVMPRAGELLRAVIHNDLNDHNILVAGEHVSGILDFGDMLCGWRVADLAIAAAYAMLDADDPPAVLAALVRGAHAECPLDDAELDVVFELACLRLALSAAIAVEQREARPDNDYLGVSQAPICR